MQTSTESLLKGVKNVELRMSFELSENFLWAPKLWGKFQRNVDIFPVPCNFYTMLIKGYK